MHNEKHRLMPANGRVSDHRPELNDARVTLMTNERALRQSGHRGARIFKIQAETRRRLQDW
jgi:hypothetical protein